MCDGRLTCPSDMLKCLLSRVDAIKSLAHTSWYSEQEISWYGNWYLSLRSSNVADTLSLMANHVLTAVRMFITAVDLILAEGMLVWWDAISFTGRLGSTSSNSSCGSAEYSGEVIPHHPGKHLSYSLDSLCPSLLQRGTLVVKTRCFNTKLATFSIALQSISVASKTFSVLTKYIIHGLYRTAYNGRKIPMQSLCRRELKL